MARPNWEYIRIDVDLPDHEKLDGLSDKAFRTLIELWCWCGRHLTDGFVRDAKWTAFGTKAAREQLVRHRLAERVDGGYLMHDYLGHQRSREEVDAKRAQRSDAGKKSAAARAAARASPLRLVQHNGNESLNGSLNKTATEAEAEADTTRALRHDRCKQLSCSLKGQMFIYLYCLRARKVKADDDAELLRMRRRRPLRRRLPQPRHYRRLEETAMVRAMRRTDAPDPHAGRIPPLPRLPPPRPQAGAPIPPLPQMPRRHLRMGHVHRLRPSRNPPRRRNGVVTPERKGMTK